MNDDPHVVSVSEAHQVAPPSEGHPIAPAASSAYPTPLAAEVVAPPTTEEHVAAPSVGQTSSPQSPESNPDDRPILDTLLPESLPRLPQDESVRDRAVVMAEQWTSVVQGLVRQLDNQETERKRMLEHIRTLEGKLQTTEAYGEELRTQLREPMQESLSGDDLSAVRYVTDSLLRDPDHIVVLAAVAQNASKLHELVENYARIRKVLDTL